MTNEVRWNTYQYEPSPVTKQKLRVISNDHSSIVIGNSNTYHKHLQAEASGDISDT